MTVDCSRCKWGAHGSGTTMYYNYYNGDDDCPCGKTIITGTDYTVCKLTDPDVAMFAGQLDCDSFEAKAAKPSTAEIFALGEEATDDDR